MYEVQVGRRKGSYATRYTLETHEQAAFYYRGLNIGNGYKKRLVDVRARKIIARYISD